jgi:hypothetical protein
MVPLPDPALKAESHYAVRHLERLPLGTSYTKVCDYLMKMFARSELTGTMLAVDETGVGRPVVDLLDTSRIQADLRPITITGGHEAHRGERKGWKVPKKCLVSTMQVLLQGRRITVAKSLPFTAILVEELLNFQVKITDCATWAAEHAPIGVLECA